MGAQPRVYGVLAMPGPRLGEALHGWHFGTVRTLPHNFGNGGLVIGLNTIIGFVITMVYKHADAVVKCMQDITAVILNLVSVACFGKTLLLTMWCGILVVCNALYNYAVLKGGTVKPASHPDARASFRSTILAGASLVAIKVTIAVLYKVSQVSGGGFAYATTSAVCISEALKCMFSVVAHIFWGKRDIHGAMPIKVLVGAWLSARSQLSLNGVVQICVLSGMYCFNNQLSFYIAIMVDPGTMFL
ncbi:unnamed protein product [Prorocentrum cordatum]|uniref:Protein RFT1 homolog n=1 Tax=Prorocentrum cordatum TaxID=2364126 RepID=A0ABN9RHM5_9DINO|nr:unnamed protein product [Polarella glacialis]